MKRRWSFAVAVLALLLPFCASTGSVASAAVVAHAPAAVIPADWVDRVGTGNGYPAIEDPIYYGGSHGCEFHQSKISAQCGSTWPWNFFVPAGASNWAYKFTCRSANYIYNIIDTRLTLYSRFQIDSCMEQEKGHTKWTHTTLYHAWGPSSGVLYNSLLSLHWDSNNEMNYVVAGDTNLPGIGCADGNILVSHLAITSDVYTCTANWEPENMFLGFTVVGAAEQHDVFDQNGLSATIPTINSTAITVGLPTYP